MTERATGRLSIDEVIRRAAAASGTERQRLVDRHLSRLPMLRSTVLDLLAADDDSWLQTGGALDAQALRDLGTVAPPTEEGPRPGERLGSIRIDGVLGEGGMGRVLLGFDEALDRPVAIKSLRRDLRPRVDATQRFEREAKILSRLSHPAICQIFGLIERDGVQHLILERLDGRTLRQALPELAYAETLWVLESVADALIVAHAEGIVHRDLKPENIMLTANEQVKVLDFGIARFVAGGVAAIEPDEPQLAGSASSDDPLADTDPLLTRLGALLGTVAYMSPEQARGEPVGPASDLFSLGLILHEATSATPPFPAEASRPDVLARLAEGRIEPPTDVDADVAELLARICHPDPARRGDAQQLRDDLESIREAPARWLRKVWRRSLAAAAVVVLLLAAGVALEARWRAQTEAAHIERFAREAAEVVWRLRATELAPRHDIGPARAAQRETLERLEASLEPIDGSVAVAGHRSIGRAWLALGDLEAARRHLEAAAADAPDDPETAWWLGRVYAERYRRALDATAAIGQASVRERAIEAARATWRQPAIEALQRGRDTTEADPAWLEAWIAGHEERFDDARAMLARVADRPWSIDAALLAGDLDQREGDLGPQRRDDLGAYDGLLQRAAGHYRRATAIGRSSPAAHGRLCGVLAERARVAGNQRWRVVPDDEVAAMWQACDAAMDIDEAAGVVRLASARAWHAEAELAAARGDDPAPAYRRATTLLEDAATDEADATNRLLLRGSLGTLLAHHLVWTGAPPDEAEAMIEQAVDDLTTVWRARSADPPTAQMIGNTRTVQAFAAIHRGDDPLPTIEAALPILESTLAQHPKVPSLHTVHGNLLLVAGRERFNHGEPAVELLEAAVAAQRQGGQYARANVALVLGDLALAQDREGIDPRPALHEAIDVADALLAEDPDHAIAYGYRGLARFYLGAYQLRRFEDPTAMIDASIADHERELALGSGNADSALTAIVGRLWSTRWRIAQGQPQTAQLTAIAERLDAWVATHGTHFDLPQHRAHIAIQRGLSAWIEGRDPRPAWRFAREHVRQGFAERPDHGPLLDRAISLGIAEARYAIDRGEDPAPSLDRLRADLDAGFEGSSPRNVALAKAIILALDGEIEPARVAFADTQAGNPTAVGQLRLVAPELIPLLVD